MPLAELPARGLVVAQNRCRGGHCKTLIPRRTKPALSPAHKRPFLNNLALSGEPIVVPMREKHAFAFSIGDPGAKPPQAKFTCCSDRVNSAPRASQLTPPPVPVSAERSPKTKPGVIMTIPTSDATRRRIVRALRIRPNSDWQPCERWFGRRWLS